MNPVLEEEADGPHKCHSLSDLFYLRGTDHMDSQEVKIR